MMRKIRQWVIDYEKRLSPKERREWTVLLYVLLLILCALLLYSSNRAVPFVFHP